MQSLENSCPKCEPHNEWSEQLFQMCLQRVLQVLQDLQHPLQTHLEELLTPLVVWLTLGTAVLEALHGREVTLLQSEDHERERGGQHLTLMP